MDNRKGKEIRKLQIKVLRLYDEFAQFSEQCAFLCDSFAAVSSQQELMEPETIGGINYYSFWLKTRLLEIKDDLRNVHEQVTELKRLML